MPSATPPQRSGRADSARSRPLRAILPGSLPPRIEAWGRLCYDDAYARQVELWEQRVNGVGEDVIAIVEHPSVITLGRHAPLDDLLVDGAALEREGIALVRSDRGGRATYHGPGQTVIYPIVSLAERGLGVKAWVAVLESALIETLGTFGLDGHTIDGRPGIWLGSDKIASIGVRVARGVSYHGVSINVESRSTAGFNYIVTCGVPGQRVTSIEDRVAPSTSGAGRSEPVTIEEASVSFCCSLMRRLSAHEKA